MDSDDPEVMLTPEQLQLSSPQDAPQVGKVTIVGNLHYHQGAEQPDTASFAFEDEASGIEEAYHRKVTVTLLGLPLEQGWVTNVGWIVIRNLESDKPVYFGEFEIPPKGTMTCKRRPGGALPLLFGDGCKVAIMVCQR